MKIAIPRNDLLDAVNKVKTVVSSKSALPILSHLLLDCRDGQATLSATDLKVSIECKVDCQVDEPGALTVSAARLSGILSELPNEDVSLALGDNNIVSLKCGKIDTKLFSMAPDEFPPIREFEGVDGIVLDQLLLRKLFSRTSFAISTDQSRYNLTGLLFEMREGRLNTVATDGRRMAMCTETEGIPEDMDVRVIIPGKMIAELERLLGDDEEVKVQLDETQAAFSFGTVRLVTALIEGQFPNYETVIPKTHDKEAILDGAAFTEAVRRTRTMTNDKFNSVRFTLTPGNLTLKVSTPEVGEYLEEMPIEYEGAEIEVAFNPNFVLDVLRRIETDKLVLQLKDSMSPGVLKPFSDAPQDSYICVVMPIRI